MKVIARVGDRPYTMMIEPATRGLYRVRVDGETHLVDARRVGGGGIISILMEGRSYETHVDGGRGSYRVALVGSAFDVDLQDELSARVRSRGGGPAARKGRSICAPMPGLVVQIKVSPGDRVAAGQAIAIVEAMKMQNELSTSAPGVVAEVHVRRGDAVASGQPLVTLGPE